MKSSWVHFHMRQFSRFSIAVQSRARRMRSRVINLKRFSSAPLRIRFSSFFSYFQRLKNLDFFLSSSSRSRFDSFFSSFSMLEPERKATTLGFFVRNENWVVLSATLAKDKELDGGWVMYSGEEMWIFPSSYRAGFVFKSGTRTMPLYGSILKASRVVEGSDFIASN